MLAITNHIFYHTNRFIYFLGFFLSLNGSAQIPQKTFHDFNISNGLADNNVKTITQDKYGYIWIGTENGLNRFDGLNFTSFKNNALLNSLPSNDIYDLKWIDENRLAIITAKGLHLINVLSMKEENLIIPKGGIKYSYKVNATRGMLTDEKGNFFINTKSGFYHYNSKQELVFRFDEYLPEESEAAMGFGIFMAWLDEDNIITAGQKGMYHYAIQTKKIVKLDANSNQFPLFKVLTKIKDNDFHVLQPKKGKFIVLNYKSDSLTYVDHLNSIVQYSKIPVAPTSSLFTWRSKIFAINDSSLLLTGKFSGVYRLQLNLQNGTLQFDTNAFFKDKRCNSFFTDKKNKYWIGFKEGLLGEKISPVQLQHNSSASKSNTADNRSEILQVAATKNKLYAASMTSGGLQQFNKETLVYEKTITFQFPPFGNKSLFAVCRWTTDSLLCGSDAGLFLFKESTGLNKFVVMPDWNPRFNFVADLFTDSKGNMWITCNKQGGCYVWQKGKAQPEWFDLKNTLVKEIYHITEDPFGNIWFGGKGLFRFNITSKNCDFSITSFSDDKSKTNTVEALVCEANGNIWFTNSENGIFTYDLSSNKMDHFTIANGLPDNKILALQYHQKSLWMSCKTGIAKMDPVTKMCNTVCNLKEVGFQSFGSDKITIDVNNGSFYTGAGTAIIKFQGGNPQYITNNPTLIIENIRFNKDSVLWYPPNKITTSWNNRNLILTFNAINFEDAEYQHYAYRILGIKDSSWIVLGAQRSITFSQLNKGENKIEVKVYSPYNSWPEKKIAFTIHVIPPFWKTGWFYLLCVMLVLAGIYAIFQYRIKQIRKIVAIREGISKDLHDEVGATLSGISMYTHLANAQIEKKELNSASASINVMQRSASEMVNKLNDIVWLVNPAQDGLNKLLEKLETYAREMAATKNIKLETDFPLYIEKSKPALQVRKNIYLLCKEAINNAVKYSQAKTIYLSVSLQNDMLELVIADDGIGFDEHKIKKGNGLENMKKRAAEIGAFFEVESAEGAGTKITIHTKIT